MNKCIFMGLGFLVFGCNAELQSSRYGWGEPYPGVFWEYHDECAAFFHENRKPSENCKLDVWFGKKLDQAPDDRRKVELVSELINLHEHDFIEKIDIRGFLEKNMEKNKEKFYTIKEKNYTQTVGNNF